MLSIHCRCLHWSDETHILLPSYISPSRNDFFFRAQSLFICSVCGIQMFYAHYVIPLKTSWMLSFIYAFRMLLIILWQCLKGLNKIRAISACHCPSRVAAWKAGTQYFWAWDTSPFHTLARSKFEWKLLPRAASLGCVGRRVCGTAWPGQDPKVWDCR